MIIFIPFLIFFSFLTLAIETDISSFIPEMVGISGVIVILLAILQLSFHHSNLESYTQKQHISKKELSTGFILIFAFILRLMFLFQSPTLSDDIYRYCLDGVMLINGENPYTYTPLQILEATQRPDAINASIVMLDLEAIKNIYPKISKLLPLVNHPEFTTIYPPTAQIIFASGSFIDYALNITEKFIGIKIVLIIMDMLSCHLIILILRKIKLHYQYATLYAWHPLPILEIAYSGHIDGAAIFFLLMSIYLTIHHYRGYRPTKRSCWSSSIIIQMFSGIFMGLSILTKWIPLMFLPLWLFLMQSEKREDEKSEINVFLLNNKIHILAAITSCIITVMIFIIMFCPDMYNSLVTLNQYIQHWEFSGFFFRILRQITSSGEISRFIIGSLFAIFTVIILLKLYHNHQYCQFTVNRDILQPIVNSFFMVAFLWAVLTPTLYPWYALYLVVFLPFIQNRLDIASVKKLNLNTLNAAGITFSWSVLLSYKVIILYKITGSWIEDTVNPCMIISAPVAALILRKTIASLNKLSLLGNSNCPPAKL